jgi:hypothetical protein
MGKRWDAEKAARVSAEDLAAEERSQRSLLESMLRDDQ